MSDETPNTEAVAPAPELDATASNESAETQAQGDAESQQQEDKTFTQAELNEIIAKEKAKTERKVRRDLEARVAESQRQATVHPPDPNEFTDVDAYAEALADYKVEQKIAQREQHKQQTTVESAYADREEATREKYTDYDIVYKAPDEGGPAVTPLMAQAIKGSEHGPEIAYYLAKNRSESIRIHDLDPVAQVREIGRIEANLSAARPARKTSSAPEPIKPVGSRSSSPAYSASDPRSDNLPTGEWMARRDQELRARG